MLLLHVLSGLIFEGDVPTCSLSYASRSVTNPVPAARARSLTDHPEEPL
jgi:hypothetical protein